MQDCHANFSKFRPRSLQLKEPADNSGHFISGGASACQILPLMLVAALLGACATSPQGRSQITTPAPVGDAYSEVDMRLQLATTRSVTNPCSGEECALNAEFDRQVQQLGARLAQSAFDTYPELAERINRFEFVIAEKDEVGSASNASGTIVIYRGVQKSHPDEKALTLLLAREMGHVVGRHHDENAASRVMLTVLSAVLFPAANIVRASTPTSLIGSKLILASMKPGQQREADAIAAKLLERSKRDVVNAPDSSTKIYADDIWLKPSPTLM